MTAATITAATAGTGRLGDLTVNRIGLGAMRLTGSAAFDLGTPSDRERSITVLRRAVGELGVNHLDTAAFYFSSLRSANELINTALAPYPDDLVIVTKVGPGRDPSGEWQWAAPDRRSGWPRRAPGRSAATRGSKSGWPSWRPGTGARAATIGAGAGTRPGRSAAC